MGRIDDALRRAADAHAEMPGTSREDLFTPAWQIESEQPRPPLPAVTLAGSIFQQEPLSSIRGFSGTWRERLAIGPERNGVLVEQFRRLAATLHRAQEESNLRSVMVTSAAAGDGKTLTAVNLALVLSESYKRKVLLVDADLRRPSIGNLADVTGHTGLSEALKSQSEQKMLLVPLTPRLSLLPAGAPDPDPLGGLTSSRMRRILEEATARFDWVILDAPPIGPLADAGLLAEMVGGTLFVIRAGHTHVSLVQRGIEALGRERILGVVLNGQVDGNVQPYERYYTYSAERE